MKKSIFLILTLSITGFLSCNKTNSSDSEAKLDDSLSSTSQDQSGFDSIVSDYTEENDSTDYSKPAYTESTPTLTTTEAQLSHMQNSGSWEKYQSGILPQMAEDAPEYCGKILNANKRFIVVDKGKMKLFLYDPYGNILKSYGIACAKNYGTKQKKGDSRTTEGFFIAEGVYDSSNWLFTDDNGYTSPTKGVYGPKFIRVQRPIGIHGTGSPGSIGKRCSHGCIRVTNQNILELTKYVGSGTPIIISPGPRDMAVNAQAGIYRASVSTEPGVPRAQPGKAVPSYSGEKTQPKEEAAPAAAENTEVEPQAEQPEGDQPEIQEITKENPVPEAEPEED